MQLSAQVDELGFEIHSAGRQTDDRRNYPVGKSCHDLCKCSTEDDGDREIENVAARYKSFEVTPHRSGLQFFVFRREYTPSCRAKEKGGYLGRLPEYMLIELKCRGLGRFFFVIIGRQ